MFLVAEIQLLLYQASVKKINTNLCWVLDHAGVERNENADALAKSAPNNIDCLVSARAVLHTDMTSIIKSVVRKEWQRCVIP